MEYIKVTGKTVEDAILEASIQLGTTSSNIDYRVIEHETKGFLGIGAKKAVIEAKIRKSDEEYVEEGLGSEKKKKKKAEKVKEKTEKTEKPEKKPAKAPVKTEKKEKESAPAKAKKEPVKSVEKEAPKDTREKAKGKEKARPAVMENTQQSRTVETKEEIREEKPAKEHTPRENADPEVVTKKAVEFLQSMFDAMDINVDINTSFENDTLSIDLSGDDMGILIGKRGQTLDSVQYLTSLVINKGKASYVRVKVDTENYRERRKATLENLAKNIAFKVKKTRKSIYLEPMNPYERRIIHSALQNDPYVTTHSEGEEPLRKVVVTLKKKEKIQEEEDY